MPTNARAFSEKRDFHRMSVDCKVSYRPVDAAEIREGRCINLSARGVLFQAGEAIPLGTAIKIKVMPELRISPPLSATAEVVRVDGTESGYRVAAAIKEIEP